MLIKMKVNHSLTAGGPLCCPETLRVLLAGFGSSVLALGALLTGFFGEASGSASGSTAACGSFSGTFFFLSDFRGFPESCSGEDSGRRAFSGSVSATGTDFLAPLVDDLSVPEVFRLL